MQKVDFFPFCLLY